MDDIVQRPGETAEEHKNRLVAKKKQEYDNKLEELKNNKSRDFAYDEKLLLTQIKEFTEFMKEREILSDSDNDIIEIRFAYLAENSPSLFNKILERNYPSKNDISELFYFHKLVRDGTLTKFEASQVYSKYRVEKKMKEIAGIDNLTNKETWDLLRTKNAFADKSIYY
jgi:hypothetical protein